MSAALQVEGLSKTFGGGRSLLGRARPAVHAVEDVSLRVARGETLGIVGESGCGKSTLARMLVGLSPPTAGRIEIAGRDLSEQIGDPAAFGRLIQYVFQDPIASLNPRKTIRQILEAPLRHLAGLDAPGRRARISELLDAVNLRAEFLDRYPHEFSGGQAQRIGIARAVVLEPGVLICDEAVSALDVSVQEQVIRLLIDLRNRLGVAILFITHDLRVAAQLCDTVIVMNDGHVVEVGPATDVLTNPQHEYTRYLIDAVPARNWSFRDRVSGQADMDQGR